MDLQEYGALMREYRKKAHLSQQQLADELKMSRATISGIESGAVTEIGVRKLSRLCLRLGLDVQIVPRRLPSWKESQREAAETRIRALAQSSEILSGKTTTRPRQ